MEKKQQHILIAVAAVAVTLILLLAGLLLRQKAEMSEMVEAMEFEKEQLQEEYEDLAIQFDGYQGTMEVRNDSLTSLLEKEQQRVQNLLEELRITKVTNARKIAELKKELATVRQVMAGYVVQIDSLNRTNARLTAENREYKRQYQQAETERQELRRTEKELKAVVTRASMLEVSSFEFTPLNKHDRKTRIVSHIRKLQFEYTLGKNVTATRGLKEVYIRIVSPEGEVLMRDSTTLMRFENEDIAYSCSRTVEYGGDVVSDTQYFHGPESFAKGLYNADFFVDEQLIASFPFEIK